MSQAKSASERAGGERASDDLIEQKRGKKQMTLRWTRGLSLITGWRSNYPPMILCPNLGAQESNRVMILIEMVKKLI